MCSPPSECIANECEQPWIRCYSSGSPWDRMMAYVVVAYAAHLQFIASHNNLRCCCKIRSLSFSELFSPRNQPQSVCRRAVCCFATESDQVSICPHSPFLPLSPSSVTYSSLPSRLPRSPTPRHDDTFVKLPGR